MQLCACGRDDASTTVEPPTCGSCLRAPDSPGFARWMGQHGSRPALGAFLSDEQREAAREALATGLPAPDPARAAEAERVAQEWQTWAARWSTPVAVAQAVRDERRPRLGHHIPRIGK